MSSLLQQKPVEGVCPIMKLERLVSKLIHQKRQHQFLIKRLCPTEADATMHSCSCTPVDTGQKNAPPCNIVEPEIGSKSSAVSLVVISFKENSQKRILCPLLLFFFILDLVNWIGSFHDATEDFTINIMRAYQIQILHPTLY
ncbi:uncharacterized protein [Apostichopus japonicus]|uniref:uncharacterized protein isoform X3 n=1 Tax=Stichopus japonicus TaxID=307972 RepID=UPI003AB17247